MILRDSITIQGTAARIWEILGDPSLMKRWNPKCSVCEPPRQPIRKGFRYKATFRLGRSVQDTTCVVMECVPEQVLRTRFSGKTIKSGCYVEEIFRIIPQGAETRLIHELDFANSGLPWFFKALMKASHVIGYSEGKSSLEGIKELGES
jgi:hypothetical protein